MYTEKKRIWLGETFFASYKHSNDIFLDLLWDIKIQMVLILIYFVNI